MHDEPLTFEDSHQLLVSSDIFSKWQIAPCYASMYPWLPVHIPEASVAPPRLLLPCPSEETTLQRHLVKHGGKSPLNGGFNRKTLIFHCDVGLPEGNPATSGTCSVAMLKFQRVTGT